MEKGAAATDCTSCRGEVVEAEEDVLPGFRFHPTDEELVGFYLRRKVESKPISLDIIKQIDIYKYDPWDLPKFSNVGDKECYFFCLRGRKYRNSIRPNRVTGSGFWKATGIDRPVYSSGDRNSCIGLKKSLVYYRGSAGKGNKTDWMMHEFRLPPPGGAAAAVKNSHVVVKNGCNQEAETWTICRIFKRCIPCKKHIPSRQIPSDPTSKTSSAKSNRSVITYVDDTESNNSVITYLEAKNQLYAGQWNPSIQAPSASSYPNFPSPNFAEFAFEDKSWEELGRLADFSVDPSFVYDCKYLYS